MDFKEVCDVFGGSPFYEEFRGGLQDAAERLRLRSIGVTTDSTDDNKAALLLLRVIENLLTGDLRQARICIASLSDGTFGERWKFRGQAYRILVEISAASPPLFYFCRMRSGLAIETWNRKHLVEAQNSALEYCRTHLKEVQKERPQDALEFLLFREIGIIRWMLSDDAHQAFFLSIDPDVRGSMAESEILGKPKKMEDILRHIDESTKRLTALQSWSTTLDLPVITSSISRLIFELCSHRNPAPQLPHLSGFESRNDFHELGLYHMMLGDSLISHPSTSLLVLNMQIVDGHDAFGGDSTQTPSLSESALDSLNQSTAPKHLGMTGLDLVIRSLTSNETLHTVLQTRISRTMASALHYYLEAEADFIKSRSLRGLGIILLKRACFLYMAQLSGMVEDVAADIQIHLKSAKEHFAEAGDAQAMQLVKIYTLFDLPKSHEFAIMARALGSNSEEQENEVFGLYLSLICLRLGHHHRYIRGNIISALNFHEISRQIIKSMSQFRLIWANVMLAEIDIFVAQLNYQNAGLWIGHIKDSIPKILEQVLHVKDNLMDSLDKIQNGDSKQLKRLLVAQYFMKRLADARILVESKHGLSDEFPSKNLSEFMELVREMIGVPATDDWWKQREDQIRYWRTFSLWRVAFSSGAVEKSQEILREYLNAKSTPENMDLRSKAYFIDICHKFEDFERATKTFSSLSNDERIPLEFVSFNDSPVRIRRMRQQIELDSIEIIFQCHLQQEAWSSARALMHQLEELCPGYFTSCAGETKYLPWQRCLYAGNIFEGIGEYQVAIRYITQSSIFFLRTSYRMGDISEKRELYQHPEVDRLVHSLARMSLLWPVQQPKVTHVPPCFTAGVDLKSFPFFTREFHYKDDSAHVDEALGVLEGFRAQYILEMSKRPPSGIHSEAFQKYQSWRSLKSRVDSLDAEEKEDLKMLESEKAQWEAGALIEGERIMALANDEPEEVCDVKKMYASIPDDTCVVYISMSESGAALFAIHEMGVVHSQWIDKSDSRVIQNLVLHFMNEMTAFSGQETDSSDWQLLLTVISAHLIAPIEKHMEPKSHIIFITSGSITRFPVGSFLYRGRYLMLQKAVSQAPSLWVLHKLSTRDRGNTGPRHESFLMIGKPVGLRESRKSGEKILPLAGIEAGMVAQVWHTAAKSGSGVTRELLQEEIQSTKVLHISTHGYIDSKEPFRSYLSLANKFRVSDLAAVRTQIELVVFSACFSGTGQLRNMGDVPGFAHAMLAAGANTFVGALWGVNAVATLIHMYLFHLELVGSCEDNPKTLAESWHNATKTFYGLSSDGILLCLELCQAACQQLSMQEEYRTMYQSVFTRRAAEDMQNIIDEFNTPGGKAILNFKHPFFWASFQMVGNAGVLMYADTPPELRELYSELKEVISNVHVL